MRTNYDHKGKKWQIYSMFRYKSIHFNFKPNEHLMHADDLCSKKSSPSEADEQIFAEFSFHYNSVYKSVITTLPFFFPP